MKHKINPIVDCVFKALLGSEKNKNLLIHFLNAVTGLKGDDSITDVLIINPYNEREFIEDKLSIVDIKAKCQNDFKYQVEIQLSIYPTLTSRIIYNWSTIYHSQLAKKDDYSELKPVFSIWILDTPLFKDSGKYHLKFRVYDSNNNISLTDHLTIHLLQLSLFDEYKEICNETERWLYFFKQAENQDINNLPIVLKTKEMIQAMDTLKDFSENQKNYLLYQSRIDAQLERNTWKKMIKEAEKQWKDTEKQRKNAEKQRKAAEKQRKAAEKQLKNAEKERINAEKQLKAAEKQRINAEKERINAEKERINAEKQWNKVEQKLQETEKQRIAIDENLKSTLTILQSEQKQKETALEAQEKERQEKEKERQEKEKALKEKELYLKILKEKGIDISSLGISSES